MSKRTREINRITMAIISISVRLILYALVILLLYEAVVQGYAFGHEVFFAESAEEAPGRDITITIEDGASVEDTAALLSRKGLIRNAVAFQIQSIFYDCRTVYPGTYTLNTSMTSKAILQKLTEEPEEKETSGAQARSAQETAAAASEETAGETESSDTEEASGAVSSSREEETVYYGDGQEEQGGWIEDAGEEGSQ